MGKLLPFARRIPAASSQAITEKESSELEQGALASIEEKLKVSVDLETQGAPYSKAELEGFIKELDAMEDPE